MTWISLTSTSNPKVSGVVFLIAVLLVSAVS